MFDQDKWHEIFLTARKHKMRTALTAFGIFWGIFLLVILMGAGKGLENGALRNFDISENSVFVWTETTSMPYKGFKPGRRIWLKNDDVAAIKSSIPEAAVVSSRMTLRGDFSIVRKENSASFSVFGDLPEFLKIKPMMIKSGRFINPVDIIDRRKIAIIGSRVKEVLFSEEEDPIGQYIKIRGVDFLVVGTFKSKLKGEAAVEDAQSVFIPITALQQAFNYSNYIGWLGLIPIEGVSASELEQKVISLLAQRHNVNPADERAFGTANIEEEFKEIQNVFNGIRAFSWLVAIGTIISGMVGVGNIMMFVVKERTREIGIRKSVGASSWSIISMILKEAILLTGIAGYAGLILGILTVSGIDYILTNFNLESDFFANPEINLGAAVTALTVLVIAGVLAGIIPGSRAAKIHPVQALREE